MTSTTTTEAPTKAPASPLELVFFAADLMAEAQSQGVEVYRVVTHWHAAPSVRLSPTEEGLAPALAVALGLADRRQQIYEDTRVLESFEGVIAGVRISTQHTFPALIVRDGDTGEHLTGPMTPDEAAKVIAATSGRSVEAVAA